MKSIKVRHLIAIAVLGLFSAVGCSNNLVGANQAQPQKATVTHPTKAPAVGFNTGSQPDVGAPAPN